MPLSDIEKVRSLMGDLKKSAVNEFIGKGDGSATVFQLDMFPYLTGSVTNVRVSGKTVTTFTGSPPMGTLDFSGSTLSGPGGGLTAVTNNAVIHGTYEYFALNDDEVQNAIDLASGGGFLIAASIGVRAIAGSSAKLFAYTQGSKKIDKSKQADSLLKLADSLEKSHATTLKAATASITVTTFDDSGTPFDGYDSGVAILSG